MTIVFGRLINTFNDFGAGRADASHLLGQISHSVLILVYLFIGKGILVYIHASCFTITASRTASTLRQAYIRALLRQDIEYFDTITPGAVATSISVNADMVQNGLGEKLGVVFQGLGMSVSAYVVAFTKQWKLTLVTASTMTVVIPAVYVTIIFDGKLEAEILKIYSKAGGLVEETLSSVRTVTAFGAATKIQRQYDIYLDVAKRYGVRKGPILGFQYCVEFSLQFCAYALCFWYGIRLLLTNAIGSAGTIITVLLAVLFSTGAVTMILPSIGVLTQSAAAAAQIFAVLDRKLNIDPLSTQGRKPDPGPEPGHLSLQGVSFAYPARPSTKVLNNIYLDFDAGKVTAIVGASGSGKSTIIALLERWYDPVEGYILLDGHDLKELNVHWLRSQIGYVQQEPVLFNDTIYANVAHGLYGRTNLSEAKKRKLVKAACVEANADTFIRSLPLAYNTNVGDSGRLISGGQKQRIAIARSIISNPRILLLDEATSALDPQAERIVQAALDKVSRSRTTVIIAHRLSTVRKADKIIVMGQGRVIEQGNHVSLLNANGPYAALVRAQTLHSEGRDNSASNTAVKDEMTSDKVCQEKTFDHFDSVDLPDRSEDVSRKWSLARCLWTVFYEQRRLWPYFLFALLSSIGSGAAFPFQAFFFSRVITVFQLPPDQLRSQGNFWALMFLVLALGVVLSYAALGFFYITFGFLIVRVYRSEYFGAMLRQDVDYFDAEDRSAGAMTSKLSTYPQWLQDLVSVNIGIIIIVIVDLVSTITLSIAIGWKLALVPIFGCIPTLFFAGFLRTRLESNSQDRIAKPYRESARVISEAILAIRTVSSLTLESQVLTKHLAQLDISLRQSYKHTLRTMLLFALVDSLDLAAIALAFWWGGRVLSHGGYDTRKFFFVLIAVIFGGQAAGHLFGFSLSTTKAHSAMNEIFQLRNATPSINGSTGQKIVNPMTKEEGPIIQFKNVCFFYPSRPSTPILRGLDLQIRRGQSVGVVGASGSGKTTIITLLERFYDITSGSIRISGTELRDLDVHAHRARIGMVSQEAMIYQGSIRENVLFGISNDSSHDTKHLHRLAESACRSANIHDFIMSLPSGYDTDAGSHGLALSGGQRQRLAIARALIRDPEILLFDEATSALDTKSENLVQEALANVGKGRTVISVAHRLSTVKKCDVIFVIQEGRAVERGTHEELLKMQHGIYKEMVQGQTLDQEV